MYTRAYFWHCVVTSFQKVNYKQPNPSYSTSITIYTTIYMTIYTTIHVNEAILLVLERTLLEYR